MKNHWSCSKFADWIRGLKKPKSNTAEGWKKWHNSAKNKKIRYWIAEYGLDYIQSAVCFPFTLYKEVKWYISNRWIIKTHVLTSKLKKGCWHDLDVRLIACVFEELVNFVEIDLASAASHGR